MDVHFELKGDSLKAMGQCDSLEFVEECLNGWQYMFAPLLNLYFLDAPVVVSASGKLGEVDFSWEHIESSVQCEVSSVEQQEQRVLDAYNLMGLFQGTDNRRLAAAINYFYRANRLFAAGHSQWEFMGEVVLNLCKALEVMFGSDRERIRKGLRQYGYSDDEIESEFIPVLILRSHFDVAHARMVLLNASQLKIVYRHLFGRESKFREMFLRVVEGIKSGAKPLSDHGKLRLDNHEQRQLDGLVEKMKKSQSVTRRPSH